MTEKYELIQGGQLTHHYFSTLWGAFNYQLDLTVQNTNMKPRIANAQKTLEKWRQASGRTQNYTPEELAQEQLKKEVASHYYTTNKVEFMKADALHQAACAQYVQDIISPRMIEEGKAGRKFGLVELSARLAPTLTFPGSSAYLETILIPYGKEARTILGESTTKDFVSEASAQESVRNLMDSFGVAYAIAETSAAPTGIVTKSRKKPRVYMHAEGPKEGMIPIIRKNFTVDTEFRPHFNALLREEMVHLLDNIYTK